VLSVLQASSNVPKHPTYALTRLRSRVLGVHGARDSPRENSKVSTLINSKHEERLTQMLSARFVDGVDASETCVDGPGMRGGGGGG